MSAARIRVLVVDDESLIVEQLCDNLERHGFEPVGATSADEAEDILRRRSDIDVGLFDLRMPGRDGISLISWLVGYRSAPARPGVIVISGHAAGLDALDTMRPAALALLPKPLDLPMLYALVTDAATRRRAAQVQASEAEG